MDGHIDQIVCPLQETGPGNLRNSEADLAELPDGRILLAYSHYCADADDFGAGDIRGKFSEDGGRTWSSPFMIQPNTARYNSGRLALFRLPAGSDGYTDRPDLLSLMYVDANDFYHHRILLRTSIDNATTWSAPQQVNATGTLGHICQRGNTVLVLRSGRILVPVYAMFGGLCASFMYYSDDRGHTWQRSLGEISLELTDGGERIGNADFEEPVVAELRDGRLLCLGRTRMGQLHKSLSDDGGRTWSAPSPSGLASSYSPAALKTVPTTGDLLCVWNQVSGKEIADGLGRMRMSCAVSRDDGASWTCFHNLESLDDTTRIEPEIDTKDAVSELNALRERQCLKHASTRTAYPQSVVDRYPRWPGMIHNDYPSICFTRTGNVMIVYGASDYETAGLTIGLKLVVRPIEWLYEAV
ncbi:MAG: hypothetical protein CMJ18_07280 [Phycisphaeraceae bacterium]|nr:hypothetical protein [Phycisphaeraceae bacterium]